jgi:uncharacterized protein
MPDERPRRFGRARLTRRKKLAEMLYDIVYAGGWPAVFARPLGLAGTLRVAEETIALAAARALPPLRVGFLSDLHAGPATHPRLIRDACEAVRAWRPDLLLLGGDFVSFHARHARDLVEPLAAIEAPLGKLAVLGNHDVIGDETFIMAQLARAGVRTLVNENVRLAAPWDDVWICGLDNPEEGKPDGRRALAGASGTRIVLMHSPDGLHALEGSAYALAICGHTHGGQFVLASGRALISFHGPLSQQYIRAGRFTLEGGGTLLVSRGIGQGSLPMRRGADPEVHRLTLTFGGSR